MQKKTPQIIANGNTLDEIYEWMEEKVCAYKDAKQLKSLIADFEKSHLKQTIKLQMLTNQSAIAISDLNSDPIPQQPNCQNNKDWHCN